MREIVRHHRKYFLRQVLPMDIKVGGQKFEGKQEICLASKYNSLQKCVLITKVKKFF